MFLKKQPFLTRLLILFIFTVILFSVFEWVLNFILIDKNIRYTPGSLNKRLIIELISLFFAMIIYALFLYFSAKPLKKVAEQMKRLAESHSSFLLDVPKDEFLANLITNINRYIEKNERKFDMTQMIKLAVTEKASLAEIDTMTKLYNKNYIFEFLPYEIARTKALNEELTILMIDVDDFKHYNDTNGHPEGDKVLIEIAQILLKSTRDRDFCARYGGEEFLVVLPKATVETGENIAERIRQTIDNTHFFNEESQPSGRLTVSIGLAGFPRHGEEGSDLIKKADLALYVSKKHGKNQVTVFTQEHLEKYKINK